MDTSLHLPSWRNCVALLGTLVLAACATAPQVPADVPAAAAGQSAFRPVQKPEAAPLVSKEDLALLEESVNPVYRIGSGDVLRLDVYGRPEVSGKHVVGPDGVITVPLVGDVAVSDLTREAAVAAVDARLRQYFSQPRATLAVEEYTSNQVTVLGRVERAGMQKFAHPPTLAEVLANAGALPILDKQATLTRAAIMRGRQKLIWVDVKALLNGDPAYNIRMKKGDIVFIPDSSDTSVYVLGAVTKPGSYRLTPRMTVLDALAQAGGATENAETAKIGVYRAGAKRVEIIEMAALIAPERTVNYALEDGDVIFVPNSNIADFGYVMRQIAPAISVLTFGVGLGALGLW
ncbi:MAG: polysaccharide biosynthesis/export family protein [Burkholderiales bacterium]